MCSNLILVFRNYSTFVHLIWILVWFVISHYYNYSYTNCITYLNEHIVLILWCYNCTFDTSCYIYRWWWKKKIFNFLGFYICIGFWCLILMCVYEYICMYIEEVCNNLRYCELFMIMLVEFWWCYNRIKQSVYYHFLLVEYKLKLVLSNICENICKHISKLLDNQFRGIS